MNHQTIASLKSFISPIRRAFSAISIAFSVVLALAAFGSPVTTSFTYQGQLRRSGAAYTGSCNMDFSLWDSASAGTQIAGTNSFIGVNVVNGLFTVTLDFGSNAFSGDARWVFTSVQCSGDGGFTQLNPRQAVTATPYALGLRPGAQIIGSGSLSVNNTDGSGAGVVGINVGGYGLHGYSAGTNSAGVYGQNTTGAAIWGHSDGVGSAVYGENTSTGYAGRFVGPVDISGTVTIAGKLTANVSGNNIALSGTGAVGVGGATTFMGGAGVLGDAGTIQGSSGVYGTASGTNSAGVFGLNSASAGVWGKSTGVGSAVFGENTGTGFAGRFIGPVNIQGNLTKSSGSFQIDHPLDPANKFLSHSFVESPDMMNIYNGNVTTDASGSATVPLPNYFDALNRDFRYQLTVLGQFAQAIVSRKIAGNTFEIRTDRPGVEVSWQVTGIRQDAYAKEHPIIVEQFKPAEEQGKYLYPAGFGAGEENRIGHLQGPATPDSEQKRTK